MEAYIYAARRTPTGSFGGSLSALSATELASGAIDALFQDLPTVRDLIGEVFMGNVLSANLGQAPARQAALGAALAEGVVCTTVNKVCASGMKAIQFGALTINSGMRDWVVCGGMESMSNVPHYLPALRWGHRYGSAEMVDGLSRDGLTDAYQGIPMGRCGDATAEKYQITREEQDKFAMQSYQRMAWATESGHFRNEIVPMPVKKGKGDPGLLEEDEGFRKVDFAKMPILKPAFSPKGTVTAANASTLNDGASAVLLGSRTAGEDMGLKPLGRIVSFADAEVSPEWFTIAPIKAAPLALTQACLQWDDISCVEINEAFAVVPLLFAKTFSLPLEKVNPRGGAIAMGHPLGSSGSRIIVTMLHTLRSQGGGYGLAAVCNGGGGASAMVIEAFPG